MLLRKRIIYGLACVLLLIGCTQDAETVLLPGSEDAVAIAFDCVTADEGLTRAVNGYTGNITSSNNHLRYAGFGVFASQATGTIPDLMYNQKVEYIFPAQGSGLGGYWTYSPLKYWPASPEGTCFYAYAPYVPTPAGLASGTTGIIGMSANNISTPAILYARAKHPEENVDLLWGTKVITAADLTAIEGVLRPRPSKPVKMTMHHALARVQLNLTLTNAIPSGVKVLLECVKLSGSIAATGSLNLTSETTNGTGQLIPTWTGQVTESTEIYVYNAPETHPDTYGIIAEGIRYITDLPYSWQPAGLVQNSKVNVLCMGDAPSYLYLIPQSGGLTLDCSVYYALVYSDGSATKHKLKKTETPITIATTGDANTALNGHLNGNTTYQLNMSFEIETS